METQADPPRSLAAALWRAVRLRCPVCGRGKLFAGAFRMKGQCEHCGLVYQREPGYFLGSIYVNYGLTAVLVGIGFVALSLSGAMTERQAFLAVLAFSFVFPLWFFRYARSIWLAMDHYIDRR